MNPSATSGDETAAARRLSAITDRLKASLVETAELFVPRFLETMPPEYFNETDDATILSHLELLTAAAASGFSQSLRLCSDDGARHTFIHERSYPGQLAELVHELPASSPLRSARVYTALDGARVIDVFDVGPQEPYSELDGGQRARGDELLAYCEHGGLMSRQEVTRHLAACTADYALRCPPEWIHRHWQLLSRLEHSEDTVVEIGEPLPDSLRRVTVVSGNVDQRRSFERLAWYFGTLGLDIQRAYSDSFRGSTRGWSAEDAISLQSFLVRETVEGSLARDGRLGERLRVDLRRVQWIDDDACHLCRRLPDFGIPRCETLLALMRIVHQILARRNPFAFGRERLETCFLRYERLARSVVDLFLDRFDPRRRLAEEEFLERRERLGKEIVFEVGEEDERLAFSTALDALSATLRTNLYVDRRLALALRVDPALFGGLDENEPYGVFFVHGAGFDGFHVRFQDVARGGVRLVTCRGPQQYALESSRIYEEAHHLAFAQQLKNKDIPEGGSKGVLLVRPGWDAARCAKAYTDSLLDLVTVDPPLESRIVSFGPRDEALYLGPDENVSDSLITWIVENAERRGYPHARAFMSSKPGAGINHKRYGVTSEGINVFLDVALRASGIDPTRQSFSIKMTGGPDGDVAGNQIRILDREYGSNAKIVGIADGSGALEDADGLDHAELCRLVGAGLPVGAFDRRSLGPRGRLLTIDEPGGLEARNTLHNRVVADAFVPAGGRPRTIHDGNWRQFLREDSGLPSSPLIVEGANLFVTNEARSRLSEMGVTIVKDSSANKCGVICSSFEVLASMLLSEEEFLDIKDRFVEEVILKLRKLARLEAELLFRERRHRPDVPLPVLSTLVSHTILRTTAAIGSALGDLRDGDRALVDELVRQHLPPSLLARTDERMASQLPRSYLDRIFATVLAGRIVYREGLGYVEALGLAELSALGRRYLIEEKRTAALVARVAGSDLEERDWIATVLRESATNVALRQIQMPAIPREA